MECRRWRGGPLALAMPLPPLARVSVICSEAAPTPKPVKYSSATISRAPAAPFRPRNRAFGPREGRKPGNPSPKPGLWPAGGTETRQSVPETGPLARGGTGSDAAAANRPIRGPEWSGIHCYSCLAGLFRFRALRSRMIPTAKARSEMSQMVCRRYSWR